MLYEAYSSITDVLTGQQQYPIMDMYSKHMAEQRQNFLKGQPAGSQHEPDTNKTLLWASELPFNAPVLVRDSSLSMQFLADLIIQIGPLTGHHINKMAIMRVGKILFDLVILQKYLACLPENDLNIFDLVKDNQVT